MQYIRGMELNEISREELLPGFAAEFPYIATCAEFDRYIEPCAPWHWHRTVELFYMQSGCLEYTTPGGTWVFPAGTGGFVNANVLHSSRVVPTGESTVQKLHLFEPGWLGGERGSRMEQKYILPLTADRRIEVIPLDPEDAEQAEILAAIRRAFDHAEGDWGWEFRLREELSGIWLSLSRLAHPQPEEQAAGDDQIKAMMIYIQEHYRETISMEALARSAHVSRRQCFRLFREQLHTTPVEYINRVRLSRAARMLLDSEESVTRIALECGFASASYFGQMFRRHYGCTPVQYRALARL